MMRLKVVLLTPWRYTSMSNLYAQELIEKLYEQALDNGLEEPKEIEKFIASELDRRDVS